MDFSGVKVQFYGDVQVGSLPFQDYSNMIPDAGLTDINNWVSDGQPGWAFVTETTLGWSNSRAVRFSGTYTDAGSNYHSGLDTHHFPVTPGERPEERRVGQECVNKCRYRWSRTH